MMNFIPLFPLALVVYPGENLNLHIFEPRYRQLIGECRETGKPFGIPSVIGNKVQETGTLMELTEVVKLYEDGRMDIRTRGLHIFRILENIRQVPDKEYSGAIVEYPENDLRIQTDPLQKVLASIEQLHRALGVEKTFTAGPGGLCSYDLAHHAGLSIEQEYELLNLMQEMQRLEYLRRHLQRVMPVVTEMEALKEKVRMNGHFRNLSGFQFEDPDLN